MKLFTRGDVDGFFAIALDNTVQLLLIPPMCIGVLGFRPELVYGRILPGIAVSYLAIGKFAEKLGDVSLLPPAMAAWAPDLAFALVGLYLFMRMRS